MGLFHVVAIVAIIAFDALRLMLTTERREDNEEIARGHNYGWGINRIVLTPGSRKRPLPMARFWRHRMRRRPVGGV